MACLLLGFCSTLLSHPTLSEFSKELGIQIVEETPTSKKTCTLYLVHHGSTAWSEVKRLQGWTPLPLSDLGKKQMESLAERLTGDHFEAIYASSIQSCMESGAILQKKLHCPFHGREDLRGEFHGKFEGFTKEQYTSEPHFQYYHSFPPEEGIFVPCGEEGESKADVMKRNIPALIQIAQKHPGQRVIVIVHGGLFKFMNGCLDKPVVSIPYGEAVIVKSDGQSLFLKK